MKCPYAKEEPDEEMKESKDESPYDEDIWAKVAKIMARRHAGLADTEGGQGGVCQCTCHGKKQKMIEEEEA